MSIKPTGRQIAEALGISAGRVSQLKRDGMPVDSVAAASSWYRRRVDIARSYGQKHAAALRRPVPALRRPSPALPAEVSTGDAVAAAVALAVEAEALLEAGRFVEVEAELRQALHAVPTEYRGLLALPCNVLDALCADMLRDIRENAEPGDFVESMSEQDAEFMGSFWFAVAAGEIVPANNIEVLQ